MNTFLNGNMFAFFSVCFSREILSDFRHEQIDINSYRKSLSKSILTENEIYRRQFLTESLLEEKTVVCFTNFFPAKM